MQDRNTTPKAMRAIQAPPAPICAVIEGRDGLAAWAPVNPGSFRRALLNHPLNRRPQRSAGR